MLVNKLSQRMLLQTRILMRFSGGHHHVYDWRQDLSKNADLFQDPRMIGVKKGSEFVTPYNSDGEKSVQYFSHPDNYDQKNLNVNMVMSNHNFGTIQNRRQVPQTDYLADAAHEYDYESQDLDYQAQSFESQHFRKQGPLWMWIIVGSIPIWFTANELFFQYWPQADTWRYQRPPPYNFPNDDDTPDDIYLRMFNSEPHKDFHDAGIVGAPFFTVKDGKKIYTEWAGVNQPRDAI